MLLPCVFFPAPCTYHPGAPYFHDAYKGWSCCNLKSTDFTVFLNYPGCAKGKHNNVKPIEPENITGNLSKEEEKAAEEPLRKPISSSEILAARPSYNAPVTRVKPTLARSLVDGLKKNPLQSPGTTNAQSDAIVPGESCKNGGCKAVIIGLFLQ